MMFDLVVARPETEVTLLRRCGDHQSRPANRAATALVLPRAVIAARLMLDGPTGAGRLNRFHPAADGGGVAI
jgi:hypothetical protein